MQIAALGTSYRTALLFSIFIFFNPGFVSQIIAQETSPSFRHYTTENGLPSSEVYVVLQDRNQNLWFGTDRGVARFDGYEFRTYTYHDGLQDNTVFKLQEDSKGRIWMLTFSCKIFYYENEKIYPYKFNDTLTSVSHNRIPTSFYVDSLENVFVGIHSYGIYKVNPTGELNWQHRMDSLGSLTYIIYEPEAKQTIVSYKFNGSNGSSKILHSQNAKNDTITIETDGKERFVALRMSKDKMLFAAGKILFEIIGEKTKKIAKLPGMIISISKDRNGDFWVGTERGVYHYNRKLVNHFLDNYCITGSIQDFEGGYWFTTLDNGVFYMPGYGIEGIPFNEGLLQKPISLVSDGKNNIYAGCWNGLLVRIHDNTKEIIYTPEKYSDISMIYNLTSFPGDDRIFLSRSMPGYIRNDVYHRIHNKNVFGIKTKFIKDKDGKLYGAGTSFVFKIDHDSLVENINVSQRINCIAADQHNRILIGCNSGAYYYDPVRKIKTVIRKELLDLRIDDIKTFNDKVIFASKGKGILILDNDSVYNIDEADGLCSNLINKILVNGKQIWCTSNKGISRLTLVEKQKSDYEIINLFSSHGLYSDEVNDIAVSNDTIYVASNAGISYFPSNTNFINSTYPTISITKTQVNNIDTLLNDKIVLDHNQNNIHIGFTGISFRSEQKLSYRYQLISGYDTISTLTTIRSVGFLSLRPGDYLFTVYAINNSGRWSKSPATMAFTIRPAWWQTAWFRIIFAVALTMIIYLLFRNKLKTLKREFEFERKQATLQLTAMRAQMNPHFIFNAMNSIRYYMQNHDMESAEKYLTSFSRLVRYTLDNSEVQEITLEEELNALRSYAELEMQRFDNGFDFSIHCSENIDQTETVLPSMVLQPYLENAIKHGISRPDVKGKISIDIKKTNENILIAIEDNGVGIPELQSTSHSNNPHGTTINAERIKAYNRIYNKKIVARIINLKNGGGISKGTRVEIEFCEKG